MLGWFNSIKEKSKEVVQLYKNELSNMVYQLDEDIKTLKTNINKPEEEGKEQQTELELGNLQSAAPGGKGAAAAIKSEEEKKKLEKQCILKLLNMLAEYDRSISENEDNIEFLIEQIEFIENNISTYFSKDPKQLVMIERDDFTNFHVFEEMENIQTQATKLFTSAALKNLPDDLQIQKRVLYFLIYQFHEKIQYSLEQNNQENSNNNDNDALNLFKKNSSEQNDKEDNTQQFLKESDHSISISQDSIEEQEEGSHTKIQRKKSSSPKHNDSQEDDNWEIDEKMIAI